MLGAGFKRTRGTVLPSWGRLCGQPGLELGDFGEVEIVDFHGGDDHLEGFFAGGADGGAQQFHVVQHFDEGLIEAEVADGAGNLPLLNKKEAIAGHAGHDFFVRVDFPDVPKTSDEQAAVGGGDHFFNRGIAAAEDEVHGRFAVFVGEGKTMAGGLLAGSLGSSAGIDKIFGDAAIDQLNALAREAFAIEMGALLEGVVSVVGNGDVLAEELLAHAVVEAGALVFESGGGEIVKKKTDEIEHRGGFEDHGVTAGGKLAGVDGEMRFFGSAHRKFLRIESADVGGVGFGPAGSGAFLDGDGKFGARFAIGGKEATGISECGLALAIRVDSGGNLAILDGQIAGAADRAGAVFRGESSGRFDDTAYAAIALFREHGKETRILRLAVREGERGFDSGTKGVFVNAIGGSARGAAIGDGANGNRQAMLGDVLVNGVVGETGQGVRNFVNVNFRFFGSSGFG